MEIRASDGHLRSSFVITVIAILGLLLQLLQALPAPLNQNKWILLAIGMIGIILMFLKSPEKIKSKEVKKYGST